MRLAITPWNDRIAPVFDSASRLLLLNGRPGNWSERNEFDLSSLSPEEKVQFLADRGAEQLICGAISGDVELLLRRKGIIVYAFIAGELEVVLDAWIHGQLNKPIYFMPGCFAGRHHRWGRQQGRAGNGRRLEGGYYATR